MSSPVFIIIPIVIFSLSISLGYVISRKSPRAGALFATAGLVLDSVLIVNYFVEVPVIIVAASFVAFVASLFFAAFEVARKDALPHPTISISYALKIRSFPA